MKIKKKLRKIKAFFSSKTEKTFLNIGFIFMFFIASVFFLLMASASFTIYIYIIKNGLESTIDMLPGDISQSVIDDISPIVASTKMFFVSIISVIISKMSLDSIQERFYILEKNKINKEG